MSDNTTAAAVPAPVTDTANLFEVHPDHGEIVVREMAPRGYKIKPTLRLSRPDALILAAWLAVMADPDLVEFHQIVEAIKKS